MTSAVAYRLSAGDQTTEGAAMRKLVLQAVAISVDGYICEEGTEFWRSLGPMAAPPAADDDEFEDLFLARLRQAGTHIMGRVTYEQMAETWPRSTLAVAPIMNDTPKVVFSRSLQTAGWPEARIARADTAEEIAKLKAEPGGPIVAHGGARFLQSLAGLGVVDEYWLYVYPVAAGGGTPHTRPSAGPASRDPLGAGYLAGSGGARPRGARRGPPRPRAGPAWAAWAREPRRGAAPRASEGTCAPRGWPGSAAACRPDGVVVAPWLPLWTRTGAARHIAQAAGRRTSWLIRIGNQAARVTATWCCARSNQVTGTWSARLTGSRG
jgi:dihydrofolate reductase